MAEQPDSPLPSGFDWKKFTPEDSPKTPMDVHADPHQQDLRTAKVVTGEPAYDFESPVYDFSDGTQVATGRHFHLAEVARDKPVALIFGSYT